MSLFVQFLTSSSVFYFNIFFFDIFFGFVVCLPYLFNFLTMNIRSCVLCVLMHSFLKFHVLHLVGL